MNNIDYIAAAFQNTDNKSLLGDKMRFLEKISMSILNANIAGDIAECGVYQGGSARLLATIFSQKKIMLFDSFEGMIESDILQHGHKKGDFSNTSVENVKNYLKDKPNCSLYPGWIPDSTTFLTNETFSLVHLDLDLYQSTKAAIEIFWPRLSHHGAMVFDDWEWQHCPGVKQSIHEYFGQNLQK